MVISRKYNHELLLEVKIYNWESTQLEIFKSYDK